MGTLNNSNKKKKVQHQNRPINQAKKNSKELWTRFSNRIIRQEYLQVIFDETTNNKKIIIKIK